MAVDKEALRAAMLTEFDSMRSEILDRIRGQARTAAGAVALVGGFIGVLATAKVEGSKSLVVSVLIDGTPDAAIVFSFVSSGFVLGLELLLSFWAYQLFMMFRIHRYMLAMVRRYREEHGIEQDAPVLGWSDFSAGGRDLELEGRSPWVKATVRGVTYSQPLAFFVLSVLGLVGVSIGVPHAVSSTVALVVLVVFLVATGGMLVGLHAWVRK